MAANNTLAPRRRLAIWAAALREPSRLERTVGGTTRLVSHYPRPKG